MEDEKSTLLTIGHVEKKIGRIWKYSNIERIWKGEKMYKLNS